MALFNEISVPTASGVKSIEVHCADLTKLPWYVDVLVVSAFKHSYAPTRGTLIEGLLSNLSINVHVLSKEPLIDLRDTLDTWVSTPIQDSSIGHIVCIEGLANAHAFGDVENSMSDLFGTLSLANLKGVEIGSIAMPILGAGNQGLPYDKVLPHLIEKTIDLLKKINGVNTVYFAHPDEERVKMVDDSINRYLKRDKNDLDNILNYPEYTSALEGLSRNLTRVVEGSSGNTDKAFKDLMDKLLSKEFKSYELGSLSRKVMEVVLRNLLGIKGRSELNTMQMIVDTQYAYKMTGWMASHFHLVRNFGNRSSHVVIRDEVPKEMGFEDNMALMLSLTRILEFYLSGYKMKRKPDPDKWKSTDKVWKRQGGSKKEGVSKDG